ncbi:hypothetical protein BB934_44115 (plasmid) [Microvirga ossetica]|uniref:Uncharacterized protein n=2 Tax=Microvirga ossetica TaxID=1882682 RepID=A0A1B2EZ10_9HYPH|nr:hypothetical protein BB934_44115 [Microvirga ossetica]
MHQIIKPRVRPMEPRGNTGSTQDPPGRIAGRHSGYTRKPAQHQNKVSDDGGDAVDGCRTTSSPPALRVS